MMCTEQKELGHLFRWIVQSRMRSSFQTKCTEQNEVIFSDEVFPQIRCTPSSDIWWPRAERPHIFRWNVPTDEMYKALLHQVSLTLPPLPQLNLVVQSPTTPGEFDMWQNAHIPRSDVPPLIEPSGTEPYYTRWVWHVAECICTQVRCTPLLIKPNGSEPYYTRSNEFKISDEMYPPPCSLNAVLQSPMTLGQFDMWKNADVPPPLLVKCSVTEHYYTRQVWNVAECRMHKTWSVLKRQIYTPHSLSLVLLSPTTPGQYDLMKNADVPSADLPPTNQASWYRTLLHQVSWTFMHQVSLTFEDADIHSAECNWEGSGHEIWPLEHWVIYLD